MPPSTVRPRGSFICPNDGTSDLDFVCAYDEDGPCGFICPVCYAEKLGLPTRYDGQREAYYIFKDWELAAVQRAHRQLSQDRQRVFGSDTDNAC